MQVKDFIVTNKSLFKEALIQDLIKQGINYLQIDDEFHFEDKIYHFYDAISDKEKIEEVKRRKKSLETVPVEEKKEEILRVTNIIIKDKNSFEEALIQDLIKQEINYLQIGDEFHFEGKIYRFYDSITDKEKVEKLRNSNNPVKTVIINREELNNNKQLEEIKPTITNNKQKIKINNNNIKSVLKSINKNANRRRK